MKRRPMIIVATIVAAAVISSGLALQQRYPAGTAAQYPGEVVVTNFQENHGFVLQSSEGSQLDDTSDFALGEQSLRLATYGDGSPVFARKQLAQPLNFTDKVVKLWIKVDNVDNVGELRVSASGDDFGTWADYWISGEGADASYLRNNTWNMITLSPAAATLTGSPDISRIDEIQFRIADKGTGEPVAVWLNGIVLAPKNTRAIVTFAFDDGYESDYTMARPVLDRYHFAATAYVSGSLIGTPERLSVDQLKKLQDLNGWDIASHSYFHSNMTGLAPTVIESDLVLSKEFLVNNGLYRGSEHFAYPYGEFDSEPLRSLVQKHFQTARTVEGYVETLPPADPYRLRAVVVTNTTTPEEVAQQVRAAISGGDWLVLVFHRIVESGADQETRYLKADFEHIVEELAGMGVDVMTASEVQSAGFR